MLFVASLLVSVFNDISEERKDINLMVKFKDKNQFDDISSNYMLDELINPINNFLTDGWRVDGTVSVHKIVPNYTGQIDLDVSDIVFNI